MLIFELAQLIIHIMRVAALDAGLPPAKPLLVLLFGEFVVLPEKKFRLRLVGGTKDIRIIDKPFLEQCIGGRIDVVDAAILVIRNPDKKAISKSAVAP